MRASRQEAKVQRDKAMTREEIINSIRKEGLSVGSNEFPLEILPQRIQSIVLTLHQYENYVIVFGATALLSAAATAMGNHFRLRIKGLWTTNAALYIVLFGKPGLGKTPPVEAAYLPIRKRDEQLLRQYIEEKKQYDATVKDGKSPLEKPVLVQTILSDFTVEALMQAHYYNLEGVVLLCDELVELKSYSERYNKSNIIQVLLSAFSGAPLNVSRRSIDTPLNINQPCISIIGTTQTSLLHVLNDSWKGNGFLDRIIFVHPTNSTITHWVEEDESTLKQSVKAQKDWETIISSIYDLKKDMQQKELRFTPEASAFFYAWQNGIIDSVNNITDETQVETRDMKRCLITAKLALIFQVLRHVCGEADLDAVDIASVKSAIIANEYYEESYDYFRQVVDAKNPNNTKKAQFIEAFAGEFTTAEAQEVGQRLGINERTVKRWLKELSENGTFEKLEHGRYKRNA